MTVPVPNVLSFPLEGIAEDGRWRFAKDQDSVNQVIRNILLTRPGERVKRPRFGAGIGDFIHQPNTLTTRNVMANVVRKSIEQWETRVVVNSVEVLPDAQSLSLVHIHIHYQMRHTRKHQQLILSLDMPSI